MPISFNNVPANIRVPLFYAEVDNSFANTGQDQNRALIIAQMLAAGTADADTPLLTSGEDQAKRLFGIGSVAARMVEAFRKNDPYTELWCVGVDDDVAGVKATGTIAITGNATGAGTLSLYIAGQRVRVAVAADDTPTEMGDAVAAAVAADGNLPVTAANVTGTVTFTAKHAGEIGNDIDIRVNYLGELGSEALPAGVAVVVTAMADGATNPDITGALAALGDERFDYIIVPWTDTATLDDLRDFMDDATGRWSYVKQLYGHVFSARAGTVSALDTFGGNRNDQHVTVLGYYDSPTPAYEAAAMLGAQAAKALSIDPARPLQTLPLIGLALPPKPSRFTLTERNTLLYSGVATAYYEGGYARIERAITTYQTNQWGVADNSYLDVNTLATLAYILRFLKGRITSKWPRHKLASDGTRFGPGQAVVTPRIIRAELIAAYIELERAAIVENADLFEQHLIVERDATDPTRINVLFPPDLVNQLRVFAVLAQFRLQYPATA